MKRFSVISARIICLVLLTIMIFALTAPTYAFDDKYDPDRICSIQFDMKFDIKGVEYRINGGSVVLYKIAGLTDNEFKHPDGFFVREPAFEGLTIDLNEVGRSDERDIAISLEMAYYIANNNLESLGTVYEIDEEGHGKAENLTTGLYLVVQKDAPEGYVSFLPFMTILPFHDKQNSTYNYDPVVYPKTSEKKPYEEYTSIVPSVQKKVEGENAPKDTEFRFSFKSLDNKYLDVFNSKGTVAQGGNVVKQAEDEIIVCTYGEGVAEFGKITFYLPGDYIYEVREINTGASGYTYDKTAYWCKYTVVLNDARTALVLERAVIKEGDANGKVLYEGTEPETFVFGYKNIYGEVPPPSPLPQTGQIWWPMIVMAAIGIAFISVGVGISKRGRKGKNNYEEK